jgi:hypothetical protein
VVERWRPLDHAASPNVVLELQLEHHAPVYTLAGEREAAAVGEAHELPSHRWRR